MSQDGEDFLSRWSRRKLAAGQAEKPKAAAPGQETEAGEPATSAGEGDAAPALTPEEIAALPKVEDLAPDSDLSVFFRKGVPEMLKKAALRRMWTLDPAIRDYVGDARDYAYDWNIPGSVPGNGPLLPGDNVDAMLRAMFRDRPADAEERVENDRPDAPDGGPSASALQQDQTPPCEDQPSERAAIPDAAPMESPPPLDQRETAPVSTPPPLPAPAPLRRRPGGR